ncbi:uncharacterized protein AB675_5045 [Cyphellophora attinorum]|uniref:Uncharacterized protein n=1 Tax=Cyphellophora attinorum TaxID=1664694 RepID=A0A0N0NLS1_9EURO|nr:uncharacterized protein AB675_5045 [Phialophora attinorum]KPI39508.1 hypothetical protein AB675_5045 [Phialophora attinorum]
MSSIRFTSLLLAAAIQADAMPLLKREMTTGAKAGMGVGIAVAAIVLVIVIVFLVIHLRRRSHIKQINKERAILAGEKNADGSDKPDKFAAPSEPQAPAGAIPRRQKSIKDRMMGPLYRGSMIDMMPVPKKARLPGDNPNRQSTMTVGDGDSFLNKPWASKDGESSPRPSFSNTSTSSHIKKTKSASAIIINSWEAKERLGAGKEYTVKYWSMASAQYGSSTRSSKAIDE